MNNSKKYESNNKLKVQNLMIEESKNCTFFPKINDFVTVRSFDQFYGDMMKFQHNKFTKIQHKQVEKMFEEEQDLIENSIHSQIHNGKTQF